MSLQECLQASWFQKSCFTQLQSITDKLAKYLLEHAVFLASKAKYQALHHAASHSSNVEDSLNSVFLNPVNMIPLLSKMLDVVIKEKPVYEPVFVRDFLLVDRKLRYKYLQDLKMVFQHLQF